jgi:hypothetical protein
MPPQVFGRRPIYWPLPIVGDGPVGDGMEWPLAKAKDDARDLEGGSSSPGVQHQKLDPSALRGMGALRYVVQRCLKSIARSVGCALCTYGVFVVVVSCPVSVKGV